VHLTPIEYRLLVVLIERAGQVVTHSELVKAQQHLNGHNPAVVSLLLASAIVEPHKVGDLTSTSQTWVSGANN
jgi:DNA-binding response OmpR family regulator